MITWRIVGSAATPETGGLPTYTVSYAGDPIASPVTIQLDPIFAGGFGGANPEGSGSANPADYLGTFALAVSTAVAALPPGSGVSFNSSTYELTFSPGGAASFTFTLPIGPDTDAEPTESYLIKVQNPSFGTVESGFDAAVTAIIDDDSIAGQRLWSITGDYAAVEGQAPKFTVILSGDALATGATVSVQLRPEFTAGLNFAGATDFANAFAADVQAAIAALPPGSGVSYDSGTGVLTFTAGGATQFEFRLPTVSDLTFEGDEIYLVNLDNASAGSAISPSAESVFSIIVDQDAFPNTLEWLIAGNELVAEGGAASYTVKWKGETNGFVSVELGLELPGGVTGAVADDFTTTFENAIAAAIAGLPPGSGITFDPGAHRLTFDALGPQQFTFTMPTFEDPVVEGVESYAVTISNPTEGRIIETLGGIVTRITDNERPPDVLIGDGFASEGQPLIFDMGLSRPSSTPIVLELAATSGTALGGTDFEIANFQYSTDGGLTWIPGGGASGREVTFPAGQTGLVVRIDTTDDPITEGIETMSLSVSAVVAGTVGDTSDTGTGTIFDNDNPPNVAIGNAQATEGQPLVFDVTLSNPSASPITLRLGASNGSATGGSDFETSGFEVSTDGGVTWTPAAGGTDVAFAAGATALKVRIDTTDDAVAEGTETMSLGVASVVSGTVGSTTDTGTGTILDGDPAPSVVIGDAQAIEGQPMVFDVSLSNASAAPVTLDLAAANGTALGGSDFETAGFEASADGGATWVPAGGPNGTQVTFAAGTTALKVRIDTTDDALTESSETMTLGVASVVAGTVGSTTDTGTGTIADNDLGEARLLINEVGLGLATAPSGEKCLSYVEIVNAGGAAASASALAGHRLEIVNPCGDKSVVKFGSFHPAVSLAPGAFLVVYENGEFKTVDANGALIATGTWDGDCDGWDLGSSVAETLGVNLVLKDGHSVDAFFANDVDRRDFRGHPEFDGVDAPQGAAKLAHLAGVDRTLFDNGDFNGLLGDIEAARDAIGLDRKIERWLGDAGDPLKVFARVFGIADGSPIDSDSAADWTTAGKATDGRFNAQPGDSNPGDTVEDLDPRQNTGANTATAGQTVLLAALAGAALAGGRGPDFLYGDDRDNVIAAGDHNDLVAGGRGNDHLRGGGGADVLIDVAGRDVVVGDAGDDILIAAQRDGHWRHGKPEPGADLLIGDGVASPGGAFVPGGRDVILAGDLDDLILGDTMLLDPASRAAFDAGLSAEQATALISLTLAAGGDSALHTNGDADWIEAGGGNDFVLGQGGDDRIDAGVGDDVVDGGAGDDDIRGRDGNDMLIGGPGADMLRGGAGDDVFFADPREDTVLGGGGKDTLALTMDGMLDLGGLAGLSIQSVERMDLGGGGNLQLTLSVDDLHAMSNRGRVTVSGDAGDELTFDATGHSVATRTDGGFVVYVIDNGDAVLRVDANLTHNVVGI